MAQQNRRDLENPIDTTFKDPPRVAVFLSQAYFDWFTRDFRHRMVGLEHHLDMTLADPLERLVWLARLEVYTGWILFTE